MKKQVLYFALTVASILFSTGLSFSQSKNDVTIIDLSQTEQEFNVKGLELKEGKYQFRVKNIDVDKDLGFVIQKASDKEGDVMKTAVENSFTTSLIKQGATELTGIVDLKAGEYIYSCPLNPTPQYELHVIK